MKITEITQDPNIWPTTLHVGRYLDQNTAEYEKADDYFDAQILISSVEDLIAAGVEPQVVTVNPKQLNATQDWLSNYGSDGALFDDYEDLPVVLNKDNRLYILDGHHRSARALKAGTTIPVYMFSVAAQK
jgi:hypothetical protein